jgi:hypothetical protein
METPHSNQVEPVLHSHMPSGLRPTTVIVRSAQDKASTFANRRDVRHADAGQHGVVRLRARTLQNCYATGQNIGIETLTENAAGAPIRRFLSTKTNAGTRYARR